ncbi:hypothetical protein TWF696_003345 [Orbilia brochopaga]|uniref:UBC core domain-containing protein n=1 Tax=Orbilia brochopaga TaxID=3140254 RepID=A0AAV9TWU5_9PEZI
MLNSLSCASPESGATGEPDVDGKTTDSMDKPGSFYGTGEETPSSTSGSVSKPMPALGEAELESVTNFFKALLTERQGSTARCPHLPNILSVIFAVTKADDRKMPVRYAHGSNLCVAKCSGCKGGICLGCGRKIIGYTRRDISADDLDQSIHKCTESHLMSVILVLAKLDARWNLIQKPLPESSKSAKDKPNKGAAAPAPAPPAEAQHALGSLGESSKAFSEGIPVHVSARKAGVGYGSGSMARLKSTESKVKTKTAAQSKQEKNDNKHLVKLLSTLAELLQDGEDHFAVPSLIAEKGDMVASFIKISYLPELIRGLFRSGSLLDIEESGNRELYNSCFALTRIFTNHEPLLDILTSALQAKNYSPGIAGMIKLPEDLPMICKKIFTSKELTNVKRNMQTEDHGRKFSFVEGFEGTTQSIMQSFETLFKQCNACMVNASHITGEHDEEVTRLLEFCTNVDATFTKLKQAADNWKAKKDQSRLMSSASKNAHMAHLSPEILADPLFSLSTGGAPTAPSSNPLDVPSNIQHECQEALSGHLQFKFSMDVIKTHCGALNTPPTATSGTILPKIPTKPAPNPGRMKRLMKDLSVLSTSLPLGVFVRVQEDRPDLFKALIIGADSTPYHLGLYEFDFTVPHDYPTSPPDVLFKTTGGGKVAFNPNLYPNGRVCLSILGTWAGAASEKWQAGTSTILQILVSIQALVLCSDPYYNEPGLETRLDDRNCKLYNEQVQLSNIRVAMDGWLRYDGIWNDVVQAHFLANAVPILSKTLEFVTTTHEADPFYDSEDWYEDEEDSIELPVMDESDLIRPGTIRKSMQDARNKFEANLKDKLPGFLKGGLWKEAAST